MFKLPEYYKGIVEFDELENKLLKIEKENYNNIENLKKKNYLFFHQMMKG